MQHAAPCIVCGAVCFQLCFQVICDGQGSETQQCFAAERHYSTQLRSAGGNYISNVSAYKCFWQPQIVKMSIPSCLKRIRSCELAAAVLIDLSWTPSSVYLVSHTDMTPMCRFDTVSILKMSPRECEDGCVVAVSRTEAVQLPSGILSVQRSQHSYMQYGHVIQRLCHGCGAAACWIRLIIIIHAFQSLSELGMGIAKILLIPMPLSILLIPFLYWSLNVLCGKEEGLHSCFIIEVCAHSVGTE